MLTCVSCRINDNHIFVASLYFSFWLKCRFENSRLCTSNLNPIKSKNPALSREPFNFLPSVAQCHILIGISEVALRLLLITVAFCTPQGVRLFALCLQIPADGLGLEHISICNCSFAPLHLLKPYSSFLSPFHRSNHSSWSGRTTEASTQWRKSQRRTCR